MGKDTGKRWNTAKDGRFMTVLGCYRLDMADHGRLVREYVPVRQPGKDYGCDPVGDGTFKMVPSGDIVNAEERKRRLGL